MHQRGTLIIFAIEYICKIFFVFEQVHENVFVSVIIFGFSSRSLRRSLFLYCREFTGLPRNVGAPTHRRHRSKDRKRRYIYIQTAGSGFGKTLCQKCICPHRFFVMDEPLRGPWHAYSEHIIGLPPYDTYCIYLI